MSWSSTLYVRFADEAVARAVAGQLGVDFPADGTIPTGTRNFALAAPIVEWVRQPVVERVGEEVVTVDPGEARDGYWAMLRFNTDWPGYVAAMAALAPYLQSIESPCNVFAD